VAEKIRILQIGHED